MWPLQVVSRWFSIRLLAAALAAITGALGPAAARAATRGDTVSLMFTSQADLAYAPSTLGLTAEYKHPLGEQLRLAVGVGFGTRENANAVQIYGGPQLRLGRSQVLDFDVGIGAAVPMQFLSGTTAVAVAARAAASLRWHWGLTRAVMPFAEASVLAGSMVAPGNVSPGFYSAFLAMIGMSYAI